MIEIEAFFEPDALIDYVGIIVGIVSLYYMLGLKKGRWRTLDHGGWFFVGGMVAFIASLIYERWAEPTGFHPYVDYHHVLMGTAMVFLAIAATRSSPHKEEVEKAYSVRTEAEVKVQESEVRFRRLAENAPVGIFMFDTAGNLTYANRQAEILAGVGPGEALGAGWTRNLHPEDKVRVLTLLQDAQRRMASVESEARVRIERTDRYRWVLAHCSPIFEDKKHTGFVGTVTDISLLKKAAEELTENKKELERLLKNLVGREQQMIKLKDEIKRTKNG